MSYPHIAVILSGCGHLDGAEIRETILTLLALDQANAKVSCFAPDINQYHVINHLTGQPTQETRSVLVEAARLARGDIQPLSALNVSEFDGLIVPGGFGAAKNLSDLAFKGANAAILPEFKKIILGFLEQQKPIGTICIAPAVLAAALKGTPYHPLVTIGDDKDDLIQSLGANHQICASNEYAADPKLYIASCSAYMRNDRLKEIALGIEGVVQQIITWTKN